MYLPSNVNLVVLIYFFWQKADLLLSFGYLDDIKEIAKYLPSIGCQSFLMSATLASNDDLDQLKHLILRNPVCLSFSPLSSPSPYFLFPPSLLPFLQFIAICDSFLPPSLPPSSFCSFLLLPPFPFLSPASPSLSLFRSSFYALSFPPLFHLSLN